MSSAFCLSRSTESTLAPMHRPANSAYIVAPFAAYHACIHHLITVCLCKISSIPSMKYGQEYVTNSAWHMEPQIFEKQDTGAQLCLRILGVGIWHTHISSSLFYLLCVGLGFLAWLHLRNKWAELLRSTDSLSGMLFPCRTYVRHTHIMVELCQKERHLKLMQHQ